ncbi:MAG: hypothetical protein JXA52_03650 [Planctomycetes bacterium]|nr:hypothetical protein [Planctomycetota bacterium]
MIDSTRTATNNIVSPDVSTQANSSSYEFVKPGSFIKMGKLGIGVSWLLFFGLMVYQALIGSAPSQYVEGDDLAIINHIQQSVQNPDVTWPGGHGNIYQSGLNTTLRLLCRVSGAHCLHVFFLMSVCGSLLFVIFSSGLLARLLRCPFPLAGLGLLLFQETYLAGAYPNAIVIAAAIATGALLLLLLQQDKWWGILFGSILLGLAVWTRFDAGLIAPVCLLLFYKGSWPRAILLTILVAIISLLVFWIGITFCGVSYEDLLQMTKVGLAVERTTQQAPMFTSHFMRSGATFLPVGTLVLLLAGWWLLLRKKQWQLLAISLLGFIPLFVTYCPRYTSPSYLFYSIPFLALACVAGFQTIQKRRSLLLGVVLILLLGQFILGARAELKSKPWVHMPSTKFASLYQKDSLGENIINLELVIGAGVPLPTDDGPRLPTGILFSPLMIHEQRVLYVSKTHELIQFIERYFSQGDTLYILTNDMKARDITHYALERSGFKFERVDDDPSPMRQGKFYWSDGTRRVVHINDICTSYKVADYARTFAKLEGHDFLYVVTRGRVRATVLPHLTVERKVCEFIDVSGLCAFYITGGFQYEPEVKALETE